MTARTRRCSSAVGSRPSLVKMLATCVSTVRGLTTSRAASVVLDRPCAIRLRTSRSRIPPPAPATPMSATTRP
ncbi:hypothetical protein BCD49_17690 [Pseudofrankia sp. EUN1h]|nr:hypothetical protein BCD49_17690 [Pseudofrankia sp. EUN1h]